MKVKGKKMQRKYKEMEVDERYSCCSEQEYNLLPTKQQNGNNGQQDMNGTVGIYYTQENKTMFEQNSVENLRIYDSKLYKAAKN